MSDNPKKIVITTQDLDSFNNQERVQQMQEAQKIALVRPVGAPSDMQKSASGGLAILYLTGAGLVAGIFAFVLQFAVFHMFTSLSATASNLLFSFMLAFGLGLVVALADAASSRVASKVGIAAAIAVPSAIVLGLSLGAITSWFYEHVMNNVIITAQGMITNGESESVAYAYIRNQTHLPRGIAWLIVGVASGLTVGVASRSLKRGLLTTAGGAIGGFIGGAVFDFFTGTSDWLPQLFGIAVTGLLIGLAMGLLEQAARTQWIEIVAGGMAGKQFILYKSDLTLGSAPTADITLIKDPAIGPIHARISSQGGRSFIESTDPSRPVIVDGFAAAKTAIGDGTAITIGGTQIRFRERKGQPVVSGSIGTLS